MLPISRNVSSQEDSAMGDYSSAILALIAVTAVLTTGVVYVLAQPTDVPVAKREGWSDVVIPFPNRFCRCICLLSCSGISHDDSRFQHERSCFIVSASGPYRPTHDSSRASWSKRRHHVGRFARCQISGAWWVWSCTCLISYSFSNGCLHHEHNLIYFQLI